VVIVVMFSLALFLSRFVVVLSLYMFL
jgi:hypothetical protein